MGFAIFIAVVVALIVGLAAWGNRVRRGSNGVPGFRDHSRDEAIAQHSRNVNNQTLGGFGGGPNQ